MVKGTRVCGFHKFHGSFSLKFSPKVITIICNIKRVMERQKFRKKYDMDQTGSVIRTLHKSRYGRS